MSDNTFSITTSAITLLDSTFRFEQNWFFPQTKEVVSLFTKVDQTNMFFPILFKLNLNSLEYTQIFPLTQEDADSFIVSLSSNLNINGVGRGILTYNSTIKKYLITYNGADTNPNGSQPFIINLKVTDWDLPKLESFDIYKDTTSFKSTTTPPLILDVNNSLVFQNVSTNTLFVSSVSILGNPTSIGTTYNPTGGTIDFVTDGTITALIPASGTYHVGISASNEVGTSYYAATFVVS